MRSVRFASPPPPPVPLETQQRRARTQTVRQPDEVYPRSPGHRDIPGTKGVPSIPILVISRGYHQLPRYRENCAHTLFGQSLDRRIRAQKLGLTGDLQTMNIL